jgi:nucleotide-binding universal stress UspA family protein
MSNPKILFPTDFTDQSVHALKESVKLNEQLNYELIIFHTYSRTVSDNFNQEGHMEKLDRDVERKFKKLEGQVPELKSQQHSFRKALGDFIDTVEDFVHEEDVDLIIMSTKGAVGIGELFGTKTAKIIKSVEIPVIVVPPEAELMPLSKVGLACDYSRDTPEEKLKLLSGMGELMGLELDLITLNRDEKTLTKKELRNREKLVKILENLTVKTSFTKHPNLSWGLIDYAKKNDIGMIGVIPKSYNYIERLFHESLTRDMAFHSPIPVMVLN